MINLHRLPNHQRGEKTILFLRRHWIEIGVMVLFAIGFAVVPVIFYIVLQSTGINTTGLFWQLLQVLGICLYSATAVTILMTMFMDYYLDTWIVTTERIINIEQKGLFSRTISTLHLNQVQDVTAETNGFWETIFTFGHVRVQTAGSTERFHFKNVNDPEEVKQTITRLVEDDKRRHGDASQP